MKKSQIFSTILLIWILLLPLLSYAIAQKIPGYVGIKEGDKYTWQVNIDEDTHKDLIEDYYDKILGYSEDNATAMAEFHIENTVKFDDDIDGVRIYILGLHEEEEYHHDDRGVKFNYNFYKTEDYQSNGWDIKKRDATDILYSYDDDRYEDIFEDYIVWNGTKDYYRKNGELPWSRILGRDIELDKLDYFLSRNVDWYEVAEELFLEYEDEGQYTTIDGGSNGLHIKIDEGKDMGLIEFRFGYTNGILTHYSWEYDGELIVWVEMEQFFYYQIIFSQYILLIIIVGLIVLIAITVFIIAFIIYLKK